MPINTISPATFTTGVIVTDTTRVAGGSSDSITATLTPGACLDIQSTTGGLVLPRMTATQISSLPDTPDGMILYNTTANAVQIYENGGVSPLNPVPILTNNTNTLFMGVSVGNVAALTNATHNILYGMVVAPSLTTGSDNVGMGQDVFGDLTSGNGNVGMGVGALGSITTTNNNVGIGLDAFANGTTVTNCTGIGNDAGSTQATYTNCTFLGAGADASTNSLTNATAIGYNATVSASNCLVLGNGENVGIGISNPTSSLHVVSAGNAINCQGAFIGKVTLNAGTPYNIAANDFLVAQTATGSAISLVLPAISASNTGVMYRIKDQSGGAGGHAITITTTGGKSIDGGPNVQITANFGHVSIYNDGTQWYTI